MLWSGKAYSPEVAARAREWKQQHYQKHYY
jgi:hypothetical protein